MTQIQVFKTIQDNIRDIDGLSIDNGANLIAVGNGGAEADGPVRIRLPDDDDYFYETPIGK